jgi:hypothetical protein
VELGVEQVARIDFHLQIGAVTQTFQVSCGGPLPHLRRARESRSLIFAPFRRAILKPHKTNSIPERKKRELS